jgi:hypothetical protein
MSTLERGIMEIENFVEKKRTTKVLRTMPETYTDRRKMMSKVALGDIRKNYKDFFTQEFLDDAKIYQFKKKDFQKIAKEVALLGKAQSN